MGGARSAHYHVRMRDGSALTKGEAVDQNIGMLGGGLGLIVFVFLVVLAILWFCLPFAIFGTKPRLDEQTKLLREILAELKARKPSV
jgi:uncharacterized membrane protein